MSFDRQLRFALYATLVAGALVISAAQRHPLQASLAAAACLVHHLVVSRQPTFALSRRPAALLALLSVAYTLYDITNSAYLLFSAANFLIMLQIIKLFQHKSNRDCKEILLMSLVLVGVAAVMTADVLFAPAFVLYVGASVWTMMLLAIKADAEAGGVRPALCAGARSVGAGLFGCCLLGACAGSFLGVVVHQIGRAHV